MPTHSQMWLNLIQTVSNIEAKLSKELTTKHGLGLSEYRALEILSNAPNSEIRMQELAIQLGLNQSSVSRMVERLEKEELTIRDLCPNDKRGVYTVLTDKGREKFNVAKVNYEKILDSIFENHDYSDLLDIFSSKKEIPH